LVNFVTIHSLALTNLATSTKYYYYVRSIDGSGNIVYDQNVVNGVAEYYNFFTTNDTVAPTITNAVPAVNTTTAAISWQTNKAANSQINYGTSTNYGITTTLDPILTVQHSVTITGLTPNTTYHYQILSRDGNGNLASSSDLTFLTGTPVDTTPPIITNVATSSIGLTYATITWDTSKDTNATVDYGTTLSYGHLAGSLYDYSTSTHSLNLTGLLGNTLYYFRANSVDAIGNGASSSGHTFLTAPDVTSPTITASSTLTNDTAAFINWTTNENTIAEVDYGTSISSLTSAVIVTSTYTLNHSLPLTGLSPETTYYYQIVTADQSANTTTAGTYTFATSKYGASTMPSSGGGNSYTPPANVAPVVTNVVVANITPYGAKITWNTDKDGNSLVRYGVSTIYGGLAGDELNFGTTHSVTLVNLRSGITYHFKAESFDNSGGLGTSNDIVFTTLHVDGTVATSTTAVTETITSDLAAQVQKATVDEVAQVLKALLNNPFLKDISQIDFTKIITEMSQKVIDAPTIVGLKPVVDVHGNAATIRWSTDKKTTGLVSFAKSADFAPTSEQPYTTTVVGNEIGVTTVHNIELANLDQGTLYHFQVASKGQIGPEAKSRDYTFQTEAVLPIISDAKVANVTESSALVSWKTNVPTEATVEYTNTNKKNTLSVGDTSFVTSHSIIVHTLDSGAPYNLVIKVRNETNNEAVSQILHFTTIIDIIPPKIMNLTSNSALYPGQIAKVQTIISWDTNEPSIGQVFYQEGVTASPSSTRSSTFDSTLNQKHIIVLTSFKPGEVYKFWTESQDASGNKSTSDTFTVLTPIEKKTIIDIIGNNFQSVFGWTKNIGL
jgi:hypothetical protein